MDYNEVKQTINNIKEAIKNKEYKVKLYESDCIATCKALDGRTFYKIVDRDSARTSNDYGSCQVEVAGYEFICDLGNGECESTFFDEIEDEYVLEDGTRIDGENLKEDLLEAFYAADDIYFGEYTDPDSQMDICSKVYGLKDPEYYYYEDCDCPYDIDEDGDDFQYPKDLGYGVVDYNGHSYYLAEQCSDTDGEELKAVEVNTLPDDQGLYEAVTLTLEYDEAGKAKVVKCEPNDEDYDGKEGW